MLNKIKTLFKNTRGSGLRPALLSEERDGLEAWDAHTMEWLGIFHNHETAVERLRAKGYQIVRD